MDSELVPMLLFGLALLLLAVVSHSILTVKVHPVPALALIWGTVILLTAMSSGLGFHPVEPEALPLFFIGTLAFTAGGLFGDRLAGQVANTRCSFSANDINYRRLVTFCLLAHAVMLPWWWSEVTSIANESSDLLAIAFQLRAKSVTNEELVGGFVGNYLVLGLILTPVLMLGTLEGRIRATTAIFIAAPWILTNILTNGRAGLVTLLIAMTYLRLTHRQPLHWRTIGLGALLFFGVFAGGVVLVNKGGLDSAALFGESDSPGQVFFALTEIGLVAVENVLDYLLQGPILFSRAFAGLVQIESTWDAFSFACNLLEKAGLCTPPPLHQEFANFGTGDRLGNVYSVYFSIYPKYGWLGILWVMAFYGAWAAFHHMHYAKSRSLGQGLLAAFLYAAVLLSIFSDLFGPALNFLIKTVIVCEALRYFCSRPHSRDRSNPREHSTQHQIPLEPIHPGLGS